MHIKLSELYFGGVEVPRPRGGGVFLNYGIFHVKITVNMDEFKTHNLGKVQHEYIKSNRFVRIQFYILRNKKFATSLVLYEE